MYIPRALSTIGATLSSGILIPLFTAPGEDCSGWTSVVDVISSHPNLPISVIINVDNGPGATEQPDTAFQTCIPSLKQNNSRVLGYIPTNFGSITEDEITRAVALYAGWEAEYRPEGIYFDQASSEADDVATLRNISDTAKGIFADFVVLNPATAPRSTDYFGFADLIVTAQNDFTGFDPTTLQISDAAPAAQQAVILQNAPTDEAPFTDLVTRLISPNDGGLGIRAIFVTDATSDFATVPESLSAFADAVQSVSPEAEATEVDA